MKKLFSALVILILLFIETGGIATAQQNYFNQIVDISGGTFPGRINAIVRDPQGYMWLAIQENGGIVRYDGSRMISYRNDPKNLNSLASNLTPYCLVADSTGILWIGFYGTGLDRFDPESGTFTHFRHDPNDPTTLCNDIVTSVLMDHKGNLWVGTFQGLDLLDQKTGHFTHYSQSDSDPLSLSCNRINLIYEDHEHTIWIGTGGGANATNSDGGLNSFDRKTGKFTRYLQNPDNPKSLKNNKVQAIFEDSRGRFWIGTAGVDGLHTMDRSKGIFERHLYDPKKPEQLSIPPAKKGERFNEIYFINEDGLGAVWIGTSSQGIFQYDPKKNRVNHFSSTENKVSGFKDDNGWHAFVAKDGAFWLSTEEKNLYRVDPFRNVIPHFNTPATNSFYVDPDSTLWYGTETEGLFRRDPRTTVAHQYKNDPGDENSLSYNKVNGIAKDPGGDLWVGSMGGGINRLNPATGKFTRFRHDPENSKSLISDEVVNIYADKESNLWVGTSEGCDVLEHGTGYFRHYRNNPGDTTSISRNSTTCFLEDSQNDFWIGTFWGGGLNRMNRSNGTFKHYLFGEDVIGIYEDSHNSIWVGTISGIFQYDRKSDKFSPMDEKTIGFNISKVCGIIEDKENNLWFVSSIGIVRLNPNRDGISIYGKNNSVDGGSLQFQAGYISPNGYLYFANNDGYYSFLPEKINYNPFPSTIVINSFSIAGKLINPSKGGPLQQSLSKTSEIHLAYNQNVFSFELSAIDFGNPDYAKIVYKLKNFDQDWIAVGADGKALYYGLPPGKYTFEVKAYNSNNGISTEKAIAVIISPPWWKTWWAYSIYALLFVTLLFIMNRFQKQRIIRIERGKAQVKELEHAKEIEKAYTELKATQSQLIQSEKMASLGELTAGIAHEIQNPLNFVNNFSEVNTELIDEMQQEMDKGNLADAKAISNDIRENEQKINLHGKRADAIVKGMLQHSRSISGVKEPININALADEYFRLAYHGLRAKDKSFNAILKTDFDETIGMINVIPQDIGRVILNLINNAFYAVKAPPPPQGGLYEPTVTVRTSLNPPLGGRGACVSISVRDNGSGIPAHILDKIFQPFFTTKPTGQGTGLGLSLAYDILKAHGGELKVETKEGEGTAFIVQLPVV